MVAFGHTAVGALVGVGVYEIVGTANPVLGLTTAAVCGIISHYVADFMPHGHFISERDFKKKVIWLILFDFLLSVILFAGVVFLRQGFSWQFWYVLFAIGGAQLPDVLDSWYYLKVIPHKGIFKAENGFHRMMHWHGIFKNGVLVDGLPMGMRDFWQLAVVLFSFWVLLSL